MCVCYVCVLVGGTSKGGDLAKQKKAMRRIATREVCCGLYGNPRADTNICCCCTKGNRNVAANSSEF